jgi:HEPN domain-containing protein
LEFLRTRANLFHDSAAEYFTRKEFAFSAFLTEQSIQFQLKYFLGTRLGDFRQTHELKRLMQDCIKLCPELKELYDDKINVISDIEDAYIMARYFDTTYEEKQVKNMLDFYDKLCAALEKCK